MPSRSAKRPREESAGAILSGPVESHPLCGMASLWRNRELLDVTIVVEDQHFEAHKCVLAAVSDYFRALFKHDGITVTEVRPDSVTAAGMEAALAFIYTNSCPVDEASLADILQTASRLEVPSLLTAAATFLTNALTPESVLSSWDVVEELARPELEPLEQACRALALENFKAVQAMPAFINLRAEKLRSLLEHDNLRADEPLVFDSLARWAVGSQWPGGRCPEAVATPLLQCLRLELCPPLFLSSIVEKAPLMSNHPLGQTMLYRAYRFHALPLAHRPEARWRGSVAWSEEDKHEWVQLGVHGSDLLEVRFNHDFETDDMPNRVDENGLVRATRGWASGVHYFEMHILDDDNTGHGYPSIGVVTSAAPLQSVPGFASAIGGSHGQGWGYYLDIADGVAQCHGGQLADAFMEDYEIGDRLGLLLDMDKGELSLYKNGTYAEGSKFTGLREAIGADTALFAAAEAGTLSAFVMRADFSTQNPSFGERRVG